MRENFKDIFSNAREGFGFTRRGAELFLTIMNDQHSAGHQISELLSFFFMELNGVLYLRDMFYEVSSTRIRAQQEEEEKYEIYKKWLDSVREGVRCHLHSDLSAYQALTIQAGSVQRFIQNIHRLSGKEYLEVDFLSYQPENLNLNCLNLFYRSVAGKLGLTIDTWVLNPKNYDEQEEFYNKLFHTTSSVLHKAVKKAASGKICIILCRDDTHANLIVIKDKVAFVGNTWEHGNTHSSWTQKKPIPLLIQNFRERGLKTITHEDMQVEDFINLWSPSKTVRNTVENEEFPVFTLPKLLTQFMYSKGEKFLYSTNLPYDFMPGVPFRILEQLSWIEQVEKVLLLPNDVNVIIAGYVGIGTAKNFRNLLDTAFLFKNAEQYEMTIPTGWRNVLSDGHCFYNALEALLRISAETLHQMAVQELRDHPERYEGFALNGLDILIRNEMQAGSRIWAENVIIQAMADALGRQLIIEHFNVDGTPTGEDPTIINPRVHKGGVPIIIGNIRDLHFIVPDLAAAGNVEEEDNIIENDLHLIAPASEVDGIGNMYFVAPFSPEGPSFPDLDRADAANVNPINSKGIIGDIENAFLAYLSSHCALL